MGIEAGTHDPETGEPYNPEEGVEGEEGETPAPVDQMEGSTAINFYEDHYRAFVSKDTA